MENTIKQNNIMHIGKGIIISFISTLFLLLIFGIILTYTNTPESVIVPVIIIITSISILLGSSIASIKIKRNGLINGAIIGGGYIFIIYVISSIINTGFSLNISSIIMILFGILAGIIGGIVGVNIR